jgi:hypothetical protein
MLSDQVKALAAWMPRGAATLRDEPSTIDKGMPITEEDRAFWGVSIAAPSIKP